MWERSMDWLPPICACTGDHIYPEWESNPQPRFVPWLVIKPTTFWHSNQPGHTRQGQNSLNFILTYLKKKSIQINTITNEGDIATDTTEIQRIIRDYMKNCMLRTGASLEEETDKLLETVTCSVQSFSESPHILSLSFIFMTARCFTNISLL